MAQILSANPKILSLAMATAGTEYSQVIPAGTLRYTIRSRQDGTIKLSFESGGNYITIPMGSSYSEFDIRTVKDLTMYITSTKNNDVLEILLWV